MLDHLAGMDAAGLPLSMLSPGGAIGSGAGSAFGAESTAAGTSAAMGAGAACGAAAGIAGFFGYNFDVGSNRIFGRSQ